MLVVALHRVDQERLSDVIAEMRQMGAPLIRAVRTAGDGEEEWYAVEGVHRLAAAEALGLRPTMVEVQMQDTVAALGLDWQDGEPWSTVADLLAYVPRASERPRHRYAD